MACSKIKTANHTFHNMTANWHEGRLLDDCPLLASLSVTQEHRRSRTRATRTRACIHLRLVRHAKAHYRKTLVWHTGVPRVTPPYVCVWACVCMCRKRELGLIFMLLTFIPWGHPLWWRMSRDSVWQTLGWVADQGPRWNLAYSVFPREGQRNTSF